MSETPMMKQYNSAKEQYQDSILFFRMGDFYEMFYDDAELCSKLLGITLTSRSKGENGTPMAGVPVKAVDGYIAKLVRLGYRVAICEQIQDAAEAQGIVDRDVVRVVTPGTVIEDSALEEKKHNFLLAIFPQKKIAGLAWVDISTGSFEVYETELSSVANEISRISPAEVLISEKMRDFEVQVWENKVSLSELIKQNNALATFRPDWFFNKDNAFRSLTEHFGVASLDGYGCSDLTVGVAAAGALFHYLKETQKNALVHINTISKYDALEKMTLDSATRNCLELTKAMRGTSGHTFLSILDQTETAMGGRLLSQWITSPLVVLEKIRARQLGISDFLEHKKEHNEILQILPRIQDIERLCARIASGRADARDMIGLKNSLQMIPFIEENLNDFSSLIIRNSLSSIDAMNDLTTLLEKSIHPEPKSTIKDGGIIRDGYDLELDRLRKLQVSGNEWLKDFQEKETEKTNIPSLKVGYNKVFGYYIEVTNTHSHKVPSTYIRKQTLKNAERYITVELKEYESEVLSANEQAKALEYKIFQEVRSKVEEHLLVLRKVAEGIACIDVISSFAKIARDRKYICPELCGSIILEIENGRHPVLDVTLGESFIANDLTMGPQQEIIIITGPNMAGKSTYIRQCALIILMAQVGSFVPATKAKIGIVDRIFTRIGSADEISRGRSTFMVEMIETANILNNATKNSFIALDEVGRGTSTFDGVSLAWSIIEYIQKKIHARTMFATHYHEMADLAEIYPSVRNYNVAIQEWGGKIAFLHKIAEGSADRSYGIEVAKLAGIPPKVIQNSRKILTRLEKHAIDMRNFTGQACRKEDIGETNLFSMVGEEVIDTLANLNIESLTPIEALNILKELQIDAKGL